MKKSDLKARHKNFEDAVNRYRSFSDKVLSAQRVIKTKQEKQDLAESVMLRLVANWEGFVDEHLVACVNRDHTRLHEYLGVPIPPNPNMNLCRALLFGGGYLDFPSTSSLVGFSKKVLPDSSNPFLAISKANRNKIDDAYKLRNYLSHYSAKSYRALWHMFKTKYHYQRWVEPGRFLIVNGGERLWAYFAAFEGASKDMQAWY